MLANATLRAVPRPLLDVTRLLYRRARGTLPTGIDRVALAYVRRYGPQGRAVLSLGPFSALLSESDSRAIFALFGDAARPARALAARVVAKAFLWRWLVRGSRGDVLFNTGHTGLENPRYGASLRIGGVKAVVVIHDLIPITHPQFCRPDEAQTHRTRMRCAARVADAIVANSRHTLAEFARFCEAAALPVPRNAVALLGLGLRRTAAGPAPLEGPYFVALGTLEPRKNHALLLRIWKQLIAQHREAAPKLVVIGQPGWNPAIPAQLQEAAAASGGTILLRESCTDDALAAWLAHARALLFPSFTEGYGMPVPEALAAGLPVIASDLPVYREIAGAIPDYARADDDEHWRALVEDYARPASPAREAQVLRMASFSPPTWDGHFAVVDALVTELEAKS
ncbi:hypothetical protein BWI17_14525 [Betaproteobacteria bacterium GR16-43]|nr:hypothetical protein BWI17_14525 [Betaproteobacteria bacterium GR16-43]